MAQKLRLNDCFEISQKNWERFPSFSSFLGQLIDEIFAKKDVGELLSNSQGMSIVTRIC